MICASIKSLSCQLARRFSLPVGRKQTRTEIVVRDLQRWLQWRWLLPGGRGVGGIRKRKIIWKIISSGYLVIRYDSWLKPVSLTWTRPRLHDWGRRDGASNREMLSFVGVCVSFCAMGGFAILIGIWDAIRKKKRSFVGSEFIETSFMVFVLCLKRRSTCVLWSIGLLVISYSGCSERDLPCVHACFVCKISVGPVCC